jgi:hypothetical protein
MDNCAINNKQVGVGQMAPSLTEMLRSAILPAFLGFKSDQQMLFSSTRPEWNLQ